MDDQGPVTARWPVLFLPGDFVRKYLGYATHAWAARGLSRVHLAVKTPDRRRARRE
jgi:hypothetical protein